jgi:hypothetical protein
MDNYGDLRQQIREAARKKYLFLPHALRQMNRPERMISTREIRETIEHGEIVENYPEDARGHSCLILGVGESSRPIHVVCAPKEDYLAIITAYIPGASEWAADYKTRRAP